MKPNYVAKKSMLSELSIWCVLFFWLVIPLIIQIARFLMVANYAVEFYDDKIVVKSGVLNKQERQSVFAGVYSVVISQSLFGRMLDYGDISVDCPGKWDVDTYGIKNSQGLKQYLEAKITSRGMNSIVMN